jgi:DinB superfamily
VQDVAAIVELLNQAHLGFLDACDQIPAARWRKPHAKGGWSPAEIVAHLTMVESAVWSGLREELSKRPEYHPFWECLHVPVVFTSMRLIKRKTPIPVDAQLVKPRQEGLEAFSLVRRRTLKLFAEHSNRDLATFRRRHPFLGSLNAYDWMRMLAYHEIRHTKQIQEIGKSFRT